MAVTVSPDTTRRNLLFAARQLRVVQWPYNVPLITTLHDPTTGLLSVPDNGRVLGLHNKQQGGRLANAQTLNDIRSHGVGGPVRQIPSRRDITLGLQPQETTRQNLENYWGGDFSTAAVDASGGLTLPIPELPLNRLSRVALIGKDDYNGLPIYIVWIGNRVNISDTKEQQLTDADVAEYPYTMNFQGEDQLFGQPLIVDIFGAGWAAINAVTDSGFYPTITSITVIPATAALTVAAGPAHDVALTVTDSNGRDRTSGATYTSWDTTKAVVNTAGVVSAVATTGANVAELQTVTISGTPTGGTFTLTFDGATTTPIAYNATSGAVQTALQALPTIGTGNATVGGGPGPTTPYTVTFAGALVNINVPQMTADASALTGGSSPNVAVTTTTQGSGTARIKVAVEGKIGQSLITVT